MINDQNTLDANAIEEHLFPSVDADVFISHSHSDETSAIKLAVELERIGLRVFVDSCVWGHADDLLLKLDKAFCENDKPGSYNYSLRNRTTANVHMILNSALHGMIDRSELLIFLGTHNSVKMGAYMNEKKNLSSPWIFSELTFAKRVMRRPRKTLRKTFESYDAVTASNRKSVEFQYAFPELNYSILHTEFMAWLDEAPLWDSLGHLGGLNHLDYLYKRLGVPKAALDEDRFSL